MHEIPLQYRDAAETFQPIEFEGITLYPITVREYRAFSIARPAIDFLQQSLPVRYLSVPLLSAYYAMDVENYREGRPSDGLFFRALLFLALALRYRPELKDEDRVADLTEHIFTSAEDPTVLKGIDIRQNGTTHTITPVLFQRMRPILAAQNGIVLESDDANPELVEAERDIAEQTAPELDYDLGSLVSSLAALTGTEESDVYNWPVLKFTRRQEALERVFSFLVYGVASASGAKFKGGNPVPSPFFARKERDSGTLIDMAAFTRGHNVAVSKTHPDLSPR